MSRLLRIAAREYVAYVRTVGFWLSMLLMPLGFAAALGVPAMMERSAPVPTLAVMDMTGEVLGEAVSRRLSRPLDADPADLNAALRTPVRIVPPPVVAATPGEAAEKLRPLIGPALTAAVVIHGSGDAVFVDFWSDNLTNPGLERAVAGAVAEAMRGRALQAAGLSPAEVAAIDALAPKVAAYSPRAEGREVALRDRLPGIIGFMMGMALWSVIFTGAGILLNSVIEEKSSRILEVLLASASSTEIMFGKILGVAGVTATVLAVWGLIGGTLVAVAAPQIAGEVGSVLMERGLVFYFAVYLIGGYLMYAAIFTAVGAFCETTREAQTLLGPMMIVLVIPVIFMGQAIRHPEAPALEALSWFPPFTPFLMAARVASQPPLWEVVATGTLMAGTVAAVVWIAGKAFRTGALSTGRVDLKGLIGRLRRGA